MMTRFYIWLNNWTSRRIPQGKGNLLGVPLPEVKEAKDYSIPACEYYGKNYRIRRLLSGDYVAEVCLCKSAFSKYQWYGIDLVSHPAIWRPVELFYKDAIGTREQCMAALSLRGVGNE